MKSWRLNDRRDITEIWLVKIRRKQRRNTAKIRSGCGGDPLTFRPRLWKKTTNTIATLSMILSTKNGPSMKRFPSCDSLKNTIERTLPYWNSIVKPQLKEGRRIIIVAHGNSSRGIVKTLDGKFLEVRLDGFKAPGVNGTCLVRRYIQREHNELEFTHWNPLRLRAWPKHEALCLLSLWSFLAMKTPSKRQSRK